MRSRFAALVAALAIVVGSTAAKAEVYTMYTAPTPNGPTLTSSLGLSISILGGLAVIPISPTAITGTAIVDMNLDSTDSGTLYVTGGSLTLADIAGSANTILGTVNYQLLGVGLSITAGPISVVNGSFVIDNTTVGSLNLNSGIVNLNGSLLFVGAIDENLDLTASPISVDFSGLPAGVTLQGNADDSSLIGSDLIDSNPHTLGGAGLTGLSAIDDDGSEVRIRWAGASVTTTLDVSGTPLPITITLSGNGLAVGVPEANTMILAGIALVGGAVVARRRRSA